MFITIAQKPKSLGKPNPQTLDSCPTNYRAAGMQFLCSCQLVGFINLMHIFVWNDLSCVLGGNYRNRSGHWAQVDRWASETCLAYWQKCFGICGKPLTSDNFLDRPLETETEVPWKKLKTETKPKTKSKLWGLRSWWSWWCWWWSCWRRSDLCGVSENPLRGSRQKKTVQLCEAVANVALSRVMNFCPAALVVVCCLLPAVVVIVAHYVKRAQTCDWAKSFWLGFCLWFSRKPTKHAKFKVKFSILYLATRANKHKISWSKAPTRKHLHCLSMPNGAHINANHSDSLLNFPISTNCQAVRQVEEWICAVVAAFYC